MKHIYETTDNDELRMISADEARRISYAADFEKSDCASLINCAIREDAAKGKRISVLYIPSEAAEPAAKFLVKYGFRVVVSECTIGASLTIRW